jgi:hypothetical protein
MLEIGRSSYSAGATGGAFPGRVETPDVGVLAISLDCPPDDEAPLKFSISALTIRPSGPVPLIWLNGIPLSSANFLANGLAKNVGLSPPSWEGAFWASRPPPPAPYDWSDGVPRVGVALGASLGAGSVSFWTLSEDLASDLDSAAGSEEPEDSPPSAAMASAPERSSPSSAVTAMTVPTLTALLPSPT